MFNALCRLQRQVALKIVKADFSQGNKELEVFLYLSESRLEHPGKRNVIELLDHFEHEGPNGKHICLVLPVMQSDGQAINVRNRPRNANYIRIISEQIVLGLDFLHKSGLIHCGKRACALRPSYTRDLGVYSVSQLSFHRPTTSEYLVFRCHCSVHQSLTSAAQVQASQMARRTND